jgi:hypothetical protein
MTTLIIYAYLNKEAHNGLILKEVKKNLKEKK